MDEDIVSKGRRYMKAWAEKRKREVEAEGARELAKMFELVARLCELEESVKSLSRPNELLGS